MFFHKDSPKLHAFLYWSHRVFFGTLKFIFLVLLCGADAKGRAQENARERASQEGRGSYYTPTKPEDYY